MSRKHWSDLFLFAAAVNTALAAVVSDYGRVLAILALVLCLVAGTAARRRMI